MVSEAADCSAKATRYFRLCRSTTTQLCSAKGEAAIDTGLLKNGVGCCSRQFYLQKQEED